MECVVRPHGASQGVTGACPGACHGGADCGLPWRLLGALGLVFISKEVFLLVLLLFIFLLLLLFILLLSAPPGPVTHLSPFPRRPPLHRGLLFLLRCPAAPAETPAAPTTAAATTTLFSRGFEVAACGAPEAQKAKQGTGQLPGRPQAKLSSAQPPIQVGLQNLSNILEELAGDQQCGQHLGVGRGWRAASWGAGGALGTGTGCGHPPSQSTHPATA